LAVFRAVAIGTQNLKIVHTGATPHQTALFMVHVSLNVTDTHPAFLASAFVSEKHFLPTIANVLSKQELAPVMANIAPRILQPCGVSRLLVYLVPFACHFCSSTHPVLQPLAGSTSRQFDFFPTKQSVGRVLTISCSMRSSLRSN
jgi:hypothetical protein